MSGNWDGSVDLDWGGETRHFRLAFRDLAALESSRNLGAFEIFQRLRLRTARVEEARDVLRFGLEGGGAKPSEAGALVRRYCEDRPLEESILPAMMVLAAALFDIPEELDDPGKDDGERAETSV